MTTAEQAMTRNVISIHPRARVSEAIQLMRSEEIDGLLVDRLSPSDTWGTISRTDIVHKVIAPGKNPDEVRVADVMSKPISTVRPDASLHECARVMASENIRRVFIFDNHNILGILTASDIFRVL